jgi:predicted nucleic acid-binding Zn ribbon protein
MSDSVCFECGKPTEEGRQFCSTACRMANARKVRDSNREKGKSEREQRIQQLIRGVIHHDMA